MTSSFKSALLASLLVLGTSALAGARPATSADHDPASWRAREERRADRAHARGLRTFRPTWVALSEPTQLEGGRDRIDVDPDAGRFTALRFQAAAGRSRIERVLIQFANWQWQVADVDAQLDAGHPIVELPLAGERRRIDRLIVLGRATDHAAYQVFGI